MAEFKLHTPQREARNAREERAEGRSPFSKVSCIHCGRGMTGTICAGCGLYSVRPAGGKDGVRGKSRDGTILLSEVEIKPTPRIPLKLFDRVLSGSDPVLDRGVAQRSAVLIGARPGCGKTTALIQSFDEMLEANPDRQVLYVGAEQSVEEFLETAVRIGTRHFDRFRYIPALGNPNILEGIDTWLRVYKPLALGFDSLQAVIGSDLESGLQMCKLLKERSSIHNYPSFIISQMTKEGDLAGSLKMQHEVDSLLFMEVVGFEVDPKDETKHLDSKMVKVHCPEKHRFGPVGRECYYHIDKPGIRLLDSPDDIDLWDESHEGGGVRLFPLDDEDGLPLPKKQVSVPEAIGALDVGSLQREKEGTEMIAGGSQNDEDDDVVLDEIAGVNDEEEDEEDDDAGGDTGDEDDDEDGMDDLDEDDEDDEDDDLDEDDRDDGEDEADEDE